MSASQTELEAGFVRALLDREQAVPNSLAGPDEPRTQRGFEVYRTNYRVNLQDALQAMFPVTVQLVGEEFFAAMARHFVTLYPPRSPVVTEYGTDLPDFIAEFAPAAAVPYLADVARLESAWNDAYHATEARSLSASTLQALAPEDLAISVLQLHPSTRLVCSAHPIASIWSAHQSSPVSLQEIRWQAEDALLVRPDAEVRVFSLQPGHSPFIRSLQNGASIEAATERTLASIPSFDPGSALLHLIACGAVSALTMPNLATHC